MTTAILEHLDALLTGSYRAPTRPLGEPLTRIPDVTEFEKAWPPRGDLHATVFYWRELDGDPGRAIDGIGGASSLREFGIAGEFVVYVGGLAVVEEARRDAQTKRLADTWQAVKSVIEWPGNLLPQQTGWRNTTVIRASKPRLTRDRLRLPWSFRASYLHTY